MKEKEKVRYGIIGTGYNAKAHIANLNILDEAEVVAISGRDEKNLAIAMGLIKKGKPKAFTDYHKLLSMEDIDVVVVATPNHTHKEITVEALEKGKNVLCEKPMATTIEDCDAMIAAEKKSGRILQIGLELRWSDFFLKMKEFIERGDVGNPHYIWCKEFRGPFQPGRGGWRLTQLTGGTLLEKDVHYFDLFNCIAGAKPVRVFASGGKNVFRESELIDNAMVIIEYENGVRASLNLCLFSSWKSRSGSNLELGVIGDKGRLEGYEDTEEIYYFPRGREDVTICRIGRPPHISAYGELSDYDKWFPLLYNEHKSLIECIKKKKKPEVDGTAGKESVVVALAAQESIKTGKVISFKEFLARFQT